MQFENIAPDDIISIKKLIAKESKKSYRERESLRAIGKKFGISSSMVWRIKQGQIKENESDCSAVAEGRCCADCGVYFQGTNGYRASCQDCIKWRNLRKMTLHYPLSKYKDVEVDLTSHKQKREVYYESQEENF